MSDPTLVAPLRYEATFEKPEAGEAELIDELKETFLKMSRTTHAHTGHATRSVHAKSHGLLRGELRVLDGLPDQLAQGVFARPRSYAVALRFSSPPAEQLPDDVSLPRALAVKVLGVEGERLPGSEEDTTQDFLLVNGPAFNRSGLKGFLNDMKLLGATTDKAPQGKEVLSTVLRATEKVIEALGGQSATLKGMGGHPETHPLGETFFTQVPFLYGPYIAKLSVAPVSPELTALKDKPLDMDDRPDAMREAIVDFFRRADAPAEWEVRVQLCTDIEKMPIEDAKAEWPEELSPYIAVARLLVPRQPAWNEQRAKAMDDGMSFNPWHGIAAHRPLGSIMRARRAVYPASVRFRSEQNRCPIHEPRSAMELPPL